MGKLINLASRCSAFLEKNSELMLSKDLEDEEKVKFFNYVDANWSGENESD